MLNSGRIRILAVVTMFLFALSAYLGINAVYMQFELSQRAEFTGRIISIASTVREQSQVYNDALLEGVVTAVDDAGLNRSVAAMRLADAELREAVASLIDEPDPELARFQRDFYDNVGARWNDSTQVADTILNLAYERNRKEAQEKGSGVQEGEAIAAQYGEDWTNNRKRLDAYLGSMEAEYGEAIRNAGMDQWASSSVAAVIVLMAGLAGICVSLLIVWAARRPARGPADN